ncbi:MAG TPA: 3-oxoacyl-ACP reductase family protein [Acidisoma sp.]|jgi:3-oxoacyl-[acyl-carrier protein] reductase|nr:3-oxoacyl-ACP reductase family protein [Acidisoma sp.]
MPRTLDQHVAIVTGAASGIGRAIAGRLISVGARVVIADRDEAGAARLAATFGDKARAIGTDVSEEAPVSAMAAFCRREFGECTLLVNNAGFVQQGPFETLSVSDWDRMIAVHLRGTFLCTRAVIVPMLNAGEGVIVNIASQLGQIGGIDLCHYAAAKAGIIGFTKSLAREVSIRGVRVNAVAPGPIATDLVMALSEEWRRNKMAELPLGRFGAPEDVAETVAFLASPAAQIYVGQTLGPNSGDVML